MGRRAQRAVEGTLVDLDDRAVDLEAEVVPLRAQFVDGGDRRIHRRAGAAPRRNRKAPAPEGRDQVRVRRKAVAADAARVVDDGVQGALRHDLRVELLERARTGVARVHERLLARLVQFRIQLHEPVARHVDLAAHLERGGRVVGERLRNRPDRAHVLRHVVADLAVAARRRAHEPPIVVEKRDRHAVHLRFDDVAPAAIRQFLPEKRVERPQLALFVALVERLHRRIVAHLRKARERFAADAQRRRIGVLELREVLFEPDQLLVHPVVVRVGDDRPRLDVVEVVVAVDGRHEFRHPRLRFIFTEHANSISHFAKAKRRGSCESRLFRSWIRCLRKQQRLALRVSPFPPTLLTELWRMTP